MSDGMLYAKHGDPKRAMFLGAMTSEYYRIRSDGERASVLRRFDQMVEEWKQLGARVVGTFDDDLLMVGEPGSPRFTFYLLFQIADVDVVTQMIQRVREEVDGVRMDRFVRFEAHVGRPFFLLEPPAS